MINRFYGTSSEINDNKYLTIDEIDKNNDVLKKYEQAFAGIKYHVEKISGKSGEYQTDSKKIKFNTDDDIPLNKMIYFPIVTVVIRSVFEKDGKYYPQVYLDDCLYQI